MSENTELEDRGGRWYNGLPSKLMNDIYDQLIARYGDIGTLTEENPNWASFSLYLARTCRYIEGKEND